MSAGQFATPLAGIVPGDSLFMGVDHLTVRPLIEEESTDVFVVILNGVLFSISILEILYRRMLQ